MSIGNIASSVWAPNVASPSSSKPKGAAPATPPPAPSPSTTAGAGPADPFQLLSTDMQAKLLQIQAKDFDRNAAAAGPATPASGIDPAEDPSPFAAIRQAIQAYTASDTQAGGANSLAIA